LLFNGVNAFAQTIAAGQYHNIVICKNNLTVMGWGYHRNSELGTGAAAHSVPYPVDVSGLSGITDVSCGGYHSIFLKSDSTVWGCGFNPIGALGDGTTTLRSTPVKMNTVSGIVRIAAGGYHTLCIAKDSTVWATGWGVYGQLGDGAGANRLSRLILALQRLFQLKWVTSILFF